MKDRFSRFANATATAAGSYLAFIVAAAVVIIWAISGPLFKFSTTWQLVINTGTTIVTFLMVFLIQNSQNRESRATQLKLDELIRAVSDASNRMINIESDKEEELDRLQEEYRQVRDSDPGELEDVTRELEQHVDERVGSHIAEHHGGAPADDEAREERSKRDAA